MSPLRYEILLTPRPGKADLAKRNTKHLSGAFEILYRADHPLAALHTFIFENPSSPYAFHN